MNRPSVQPDTHGNQSEVIQAQPEGCADRFRFAASFTSLLSQLLPLLLGLFATVASVARCHAGVTLITHGLNGDVEGWVTGMANRIPKYRDFPGTNFTCYKAFFYTTGGPYFLTASRVAGSPPRDSTSGEIIVKFDWSQLADGNSHNTYQIAQAAAMVLLNTNFIPELGGHALAEQPLHLIGHSRGGSLVCELSRLLGTNGVWVDHLTTLDPHPLNNDGFVLDALLYSAVDAPARTYANVLFHDNYWQDLDFFVYGEAVAGAYVRQLHSLSGGYSNPHSNVHLWYHGTIDERIPTTDSTAALTAAERANWWTAYETQGRWAGFYYSRLGLGNRLSTIQPAGTGLPAIRDGYNQLWDLGAGGALNRTGLPGNNGDWPSLIQFHRTQTNQVFQGQSMPVKLAYQWTRPTTSAGTLRFYLDEDLNPWNHNEQLVYEIVMAGTGSAAFIGNATLAIPCSVTNTAPGWHHLLAAIRAGAQTRYLYAPEPVEILANPAPRLDLVRLNPDRFQVGVNGVAGQTLVLQSSSDLATWQAVATNTLLTNRWLWTNNPPSSATNQFYRARLSGF